MMQHVKRLRCHHDHLKTLDDCYSVMRHNQTYDRMRDAQFRCDPVKMRQLDSSHFTSLIVRLSPDQGQGFFAAVRQAYEELRSLILRFDPGAAIEIYFDSAHVTIRSLEDGL